MRPWLAVGPPLPDVPLGGQDWNQAAVVREVDGDTVRLLRRRVTFRVAGEPDDQGQLVCTDYLVRVLEDDLAEFPGGIAGRLVTLDTPELHAKDPAERAAAKEAAADLTHWCEMNAGELRCITYDTGGGFDRLLVDLYVLEADGTRYSASEWMLERGWPPYVRGV